MLSNKNYPYIVKSGGLLRGRIHKHDIKNEDTNDSYKGQKLSKVQEKVKERRKKQKSCHFSRKTTQQLFFFYEKKKIYDLSSDDDDDDD